MSDGELMVMFGPPAVGKMTVGRAVCERTDFRLFLNHHTIEPLAEIFGMDSRPFRTLTGEFRRRVVEEAAAANVALMLTLVWNLGGIEDARWVSDLVSPYANVGLPVSFVELSADLETRLGRNRGEDRLHAKPSKRDLAWSDRHLRERESWVMNTDPTVRLPADGVLAAHRHLRVDNRQPEPQTTAERIVAWHAAT
jgi:shikimate kinase